MKTLLLACFLLYPAFSETPDAKIATLVKSFEGSALWSNSSIFPVLDLPATASTAQVLDLLLKRDFPGFRTYSIAAIETVWMVLDHVPVDRDGKPEWTPVKEPITVARIRTNAGERIVFMKYREKRGWLTTVYNCK